MEPKIFTKPNTFLYRIEKLAWQFWEKPFIRFLFVGGVNTVLGYLTTLLLRYTLFITDPKWILFPGLVEIDASNTVMFLLLFPVSYTLQALLAFRQRWQWQRLLVYPFTSIPNYLLQQGFIFVFENLFSLPPTISYALSAILPIPLMFFVIRFFVTTQKTQSL
ncbi:MAG: GtrA family protein [Bacilli bacterium]